MTKTRIVQCFALCIWGIPAMAQYMWQEGNDSEKTDLGKGIEYGVEMSKKIDEVTKNLKED